MMITCIYSPVATFWYDIQFNQNQVCISETMSEFEVVVVKMENGNSELEEKEKRIHSRLKVTFYDIYTCMSIFKKMYPVNRCNNNFDQVMYVPYFWSIRLGNC